MNCEPALSVQPTNTENEDEDRKSVTTEAILTRLRSLPAGQLVTVMPQKAVLGASSLNTYSFLRQFGIRYDGASHPEEGS